MPTDMPESPAEVPAPVTPPPDTELDPTPDEGAPAEPPPDVAPDEDAPERAVPT
jgi:hypothetical protein